MEPTTSQPDAQERKLLHPSELGTKEYWDAVYARELQNHEDDAEDEGTIWFGESNAEEAILGQLSALEQQGLLRRQLEVNRWDEGVYDQNLCREGTREPSRFLDLGTGNGHLLFMLRDEDEHGRRWMGEMVGVDCSEASVQLARRVLSRRQAESVQEALEQDQVDHPEGEAPHSAGSNDRHAVPLRFEQWDLLQDPPGDWLKDGFDMVLDKGTFDAISLMPHSTDGRPAPVHPCETYREQVIPLMKPGSFLCVTSCNWTKAELLEWLTPPDGELSYLSEAQYPTFTFGGQSGQSIVTIVFRRCKLM